MKPSPNTFQHSFVQHRLMFAVALGNELFSSELSESLSRASLACTENNKRETGIIDFVCGLYLQYHEQVAIHFRGDLPAIVNRNFPIHRFGRDGRLPKVMLDHMASGDH